jgi:hypothetical protein
MEHVAQETKDTFYNQLSMHLPAAPNTDFSWAFAWAPPARGARLAPLAGGAPGSRLSFKDGETVGIVAPWIRPAVRVADRTLEYEGWAGSASSGADGRDTLIQMSGNRIARPGGLGIDGDGPFRAETRDGAVTLSVSGTARALTVQGVRPASLRGRGCRVERLSRTTCRVRVPGGNATVRATLA